MEKKELIDFANGIKEICVENGRLQHRLDESQNYIKKLETENRKLKYEYEDSLLNRDKPLPTKWRKRTFTNGESLVEMFCPKCDNRVANWYSYCNECGQKLAEGNLMPEMEIKEENEGL